MAKKFPAAVFNQCRQEAEEEEEEEENTVLTYFCSKFYTCPASNLQKTRSSKLVRHSKHTCGRRQKALLRREREREREREGEGERGRALFLFLQSSPASTLGCYDYRAQCFFQVVIVLSSERLAAADPGANVLLITPARKCCRESYFTQNKQNHNQLITKAGLESLLHFLQVQKTGTRKRETRRETQTERKRDMNKLWNATNRRR